jgi:hypothetical protein
MICVKCGLIKTGKNGDFECDDCREFSPIIQEVYKIIDSTITNSDVIDPDTERILQLMADCTFVTANNPQTAIFYKICELIIQKAYAQEYEITEQELNKSVRTTRSWGDVFKLFQDLGLITVRIEDFQRIITLTDKTKKLAQQFGTTSSFNEQVVVRLAHIYAGYILLHIINEMSYLQEDTDVPLPYGIKPKTLWNVLMFILENAYRGQQTFSEEEFTKFVSKRRIPSTTRGDIIRSLQTMSGRTTQDLIKEVIIADNQISFKLEDYVMVEMKRVRDTRSRDR